MEFPRVSIKRQNEAITQSGGMEMFSPVEEFARQIARSTDAAITSCLDKLVGQAGNWKRWRWNASRIQTQQRQEPGTE